MNDLNKELRGQAVKLGICDEFLKLWSNDWSREKMVEMMYRGLDFCLIHHYPSNDFIVKHFSLDFLRKSNVFVNDRYSVVNPKKSLILGTSDVTFRYNMWENGRIYVRDNASLKLYAKNRCFVIVHLFDNATVDAEQLDKASVIIIKHSPKVTIRTNGSIKVKEEYNYLK